MRDKTMDLIMDVFASTKNVKMHSDEQHVLASHKMQCAFLLTLEFSKLYFIW
jgi:hypothetical protein